MKCYKCGYDFTGGNSCPKCGASAIMVNEDYLRRKKEYEESGRITFKELEFKQSDDKEENLVFDDEAFEPVDFIKNVYDKMKLKSSKSAKRKTPQIKRSKNKVKKSDGFMMLKYFAKAKKFLPYFAIALVLVIVIAIFILIHERNTDYIYAVSTDKNSRLKGLSVLYYGDGMSVTANGKTTKITEKTVTGVNYNSTFSGILYETGEGIYYHNGKSSTRVYDGLLKDVTSYYISPSGGTMAFVVLEDNTYIVYQFYKGKLEIISKGADSKEILVAIDDGTVFYKEIEYSSINGVNSVCLKSYSDGVRKIITEEFIDGVYCAKTGALVTLDKNGDLISHSGKNYTSSQIIMSNIYGILKENSENVYTIYGDNYLGTNCEYLVAIGEDTVAIKLQDMSIKKLYNDLTFDKILIFKGNFYGIKNDELIDENGKKICNITDCMPVFDDKKSAFLFMDNGKLKMISGNKVRNIAKVSKTPSGIMTSKKYYVYSTDDGQIIVLNKNGRKISSLKNTYLITK